jgi:hypothetical protein
MVREPDATHGRTIHLGQKQKRISQIGMSVLPGTADMRRLHRHVGFAPILLQKSAVK